jgi:hypothetical protein
MVALKYGRDRADNSLIPEGPTKNQDQHPLSHSTRRIMLPSGRSIEVIRFDEAGALPSKGFDIGLHVCPRCGSELVQPIQWGEVSDRHVELTLHCPNCNWTRHGNYDEEQVTEFEDRLDDGVAAVLGDLRRLTNANMADEIDRFADALALDLILPEDF